MSYRSSAEGKDITAAYVNHAKHTSVLITHGHINTDG